MAQTTAAVASACAKVEISTDGVTFTDVSGVAQSIGGTEQTRTTGSANTFASRKPIVKAGNYEPMTLTVVIVYSETDAEGYQQVRSVFEAAACEPDFYLRWSPKGGGADAEQITTDKGVLSSFTYPPVDATSGDPILGGFSVFIPGVTTTIVAS